ncbi:hypothetical protein CEXT_114581 [Caerostris extrusa]|uniref:Uncharacterized protein n=1 Tax=Caerostris extrusa TaxID=172846 RepID=A0AAV4X782_CAEEX|nr:hypothetical protein CEXT_114581 [Caerostris extrusa]
MQLDAAEAVPAHRLLLLLEPECLSLAADDREGWHLAATIVKGAEWLDKSCYSMNPFLILQRASPHRSSFFGMVLPGRPAVQILECLILNAIMGIGYVA